MSYMRFNLTPVEADSQTLIDIPARRPSLLQRLSLRLARWQQNARDRRALAQMGTRDLRDAGLWQAMVEYELSQPRWRPLRDWRF